MMWGHEIIEELTLYKNLPFKNGLSVFQLGISVAWTALQISLAGMLAEAL